MGRCIVVTSGKGGVGKTTITATLGASIASEGASVVLVDADVGLNNLDLVLGVENMINYDVIDVIKGRCRLVEAVIKHPFYDNLSLLSSRALVNGELRQETFSAVITALRRMYDFIIIDCPAGIDEGFNRAVSVADEALIVITPVPSSVRDADKVINLMGNYKLRRVGIVVNRVRGDLVLKGDMLGVNDIASVIRVPVVGAVPEDDEVILSATLGKVSDSDSRQYTAVSMLANYILRGTARVYDCTARYRGIAGLFRKLAR